MAVSNLTGTKWLIKEWPSITASTDTTYNIQFKANNIDYTALRLRNNNGYNYIYYNTTTVFDSDLGSWGDYEDYRTITITSGTDVTNVNLISWLEANATQQAEPNPLVETTISVGTKQLYNAYLGQGALQKIYKGTSLIFNRLEANFETSDHNLLITSNGDVFNVQEESGFTVSGTSDINDSEAVSYSTDNGVTWTKIQKGSFTLPAMTTFKLKIGGLADFLTSATSTQLGLNLPLSETSTQISDNYTLTQNITDLTIHGEWD